MYFYIEIKELETAKVIKRLDCTDNSKRSREKIESGMNINLNHEEYYTFSFESETQLPII